MIPPNVKAGIFAGESGGDYDALFGYSQRDGGQFAGVRPTQMTVGDVLQFQSPSGPYGQWVKGQVGHVATPIGAYQIVGTTLRGAVDAGVVRPDEVFSQDVQDRVGNWIYQTQGTGAWEGYRPNGGGNVQTVSTKSPGLLGQPEQPRGLLGMNPERLDRLSLALMALSGSPSLQPLMANVAGRMEDRRDERKTAEKTNLTLQWLNAQPGGSTYTQLANILGPEGAINAYMQDQRAGQSAGGVQSTNWLPDGSGAVTQMRDGSLVVRTAGGETLTGQAANDFVAKSNSAYTDQQRSIYGARREGSLAAEIDLGGEAERVAAEGKMAPQVAREYLGKAELVGSSVRNMRDAIRAIDEGAQSGVVYNMLPNVTVASAELANARQRLGLDVIGSVTFGALSEGEMQLAMDTAMPSGLGPEQLREWLVRKTAAQEKAHAALMEASMHFASGGTMADYLKKIGAGASTAAPTPTGGNVIRYDAQGNRIE